MTSIAQAPPRQIVVGIDTHKYVHVAVALDPFGAVLGNTTIAADSGGYARLATWIEN